MIVSRNDRPTGDDIRPSPSGTTPLQGAGASVDRVPDPALGIFESLLVWEGRPIELDAHLARLQESARVLYGISLPDRLASDVEAEARRGPPCARLAIDLDPRRSPGHRITYRSEELSPDIVFPPPAEGIEVEVLRLHHGLGAHKWRDRRLVEGGGGPEEDPQPLIVDPEGRVLETGRGSLFAIRDEVLRTPSLDGRILPGIGRRRILEIAARRGLSVSVGDMTLDELAGAEEAFSTNSVRGIEPLRGCRGLAAWTCRGVTGELRLEMARGWSIPVSEH
ncbi:MAG: aminotransferase class IV [Actinobacteria bacterium]|nr:aminotransferase class IV [Actinomycetota bacterium]